MLRALLWGIKDWRSVLFTTSPSYAFQRTGSGDFGFGCYGNQVHMMWCQVQTAWLEWPRSTATSAPPCQTARAPRNLILCHLQADQGQSQSPKASVWNEKYVCLRNKRKMSERKIGRQIECAQMCLAPLSNMDAVWLGRPGDTVSGFQSKLRPPALESPLLIPIMESCRCELRCRGSADHIICSPAQAEPPVKRKLFSRDIVAGDVSAIIHLPEQRNHSTVNPSPRCRYTPCPLLSLFLKPCLFFSFPLLSFLSVWPSPSPIESEIVMDRACSNCTARRPSRPHGPLPSHQYLCNAADWKRTHVSHAPHTYRACKHKQQHLLPPTA